MNKLDSCNDSCDFNSIKRLEETVPLYKTVCAGINDEFKIKSWTKDFSFDDVLKYIERYETTLSSDYEFRFSPSLELIIRDYYSGVKVPGLPYNIINPCKFPFDIKRLPSVFQYGDTLNNDDFSVNGVKITNCELLKKIIEFYCIDPVDSKEYRLDKILNSSAFTLRYCCVCGKIYKVSKKKINEIPLCSRGCKSKYDKMNKDNVKILDKCLYCKGDISLPYGNGIVGSPVCNIGCELEFLRNLVIYYLRLTSIKEINRYVKEFNDKIDEVYKWLWSDNHLNNS